SLANWPVSPCFDLPLRSDRHGVAGGQDLDTGVKELALGARAPLQVGGDGFCGNRFRSTNEHLHLRSGADAFGIGRVIERLYSETVASQEQFVPSCVVNREGKHSLEMVHQVAPPARVTLQKRFRVARTAP